jgi:hypothetical protein
VLSNFHRTDLTRCSLCGNEQLAPASQSCQRACIQKGTKNLFIVDDISDSSVLYKNIQVNHIFCSLFSTLPFPSSKFPSTCLTRQGSNWKNLIRQFR